MRIATTLGILTLATAMLASRPAQAANGPPAGPLAQVTRVLSNYQDVGKVTDVKVGAVMAKTAMLAEIRWVPKPEMVPQSAQASQSMRLQWEKLPEDQRSKFADRHREEVQIWWVDGLPEKDAARLVGKLEPQAKSVERFCESVYLGHDGERAWFGYMPIYEWIRLQRAMSLKGGENATAGALRGLTVGDYGSGTGSSCSDILASEGPRALPAIDALIGAKKESRRTAVHAMAPSKDKAVIAWLMERAKSPDKEVAAAAHWALCAYPRQEATDLYVEWFAEAIKEHKHQRELYACIAVNAEAAKPLLPEYLKAPENVRAYRSALEFSRKLNGKPVAEKLLQAEQTVIRTAIPQNPEHDLAKARQATRTIMESDDREAAAAIGLCLANLFAKANTGEVHKAGEEILRNVKGGKELVHRLAETLTDYDAEQIKKLDERLRG